MYTYTTATCMWTHSYQELQGREKLSHVASVGNEVLAVLRARVVLQHQGGEGAHALQVLQLSSRTELGGAKEGGEQESVTFDVAVQDITVLDYAPSSLSTRYLPLHAKA